MKRIRIYRVFVVVASALSLLVNVNAAEALECYKKFWAVYRCSSCEDTQIITVLPMHLGEMVCSHGFGRKIGDMIRDMENLH